MFTSDDLWRVATAIYDGVVDLDQSSKDIQDLALQRARAAVEAMGLQLADQ